MEAEKALAVLLRLPIPRILQVVLHRPTVVEDQSPNVVQIAEERFIVTIMMDASLFVVKEKIVK